MPRSDSTIRRPDLGVIAYEYSLTAAKQGFIGAQVLPAFHTGEKTAQYPVIPAEAILEVADVERAARSAYSRGDWTFEMQDYTCREFGREEPLDDSEASLYRKYFDAEAVAVQRATMIVLRGYEKRVADKVMNTTTFANSAAAHAWDSYTNADPLADVNTAKRAFRTSVGLKPNALILDEDLLRHVSMCDAVMDRVKYTSPNALRGELTIEQLKAYFGVEFILAAGAVYNSAGKKRPKSISTIWPSDKVLVARVSTGGQDLQEPCLGRTFIWDEDAPELLVTEQYREEQSRSNVYRVRQYTDECIQFAGAGYILTGVTTA